MRPKVNIKSNFSKSIVEKVFDESIFMLQTNETLKVTTSRFNVSISTVWRDMRERLYLINWEHYKKINLLINSHKRGSD